MARNNLLKLAAILIPAALLMGGRKKKTPSIKSPKLPAPSKPNQEVAVPGDDKSLAEKFFDLGEDEYEKGNYAKAIGYFKRSYELSHEPELLFDIAQCLCKLERYAEAKQMFENFLAEQPTGELADKARAMIALCITHLRKQGQPSQPSQLPPKGGAAAASDKDEPDDDGVFGAEAEKDAERKLPQMKKASELNTEQARTHKAARAAAYKAQYAMRKGSEEIDYLPENVARRAAVYLKTYLENGGMVAANVAIAQMEMGLEGQVTLGVLDDRTLDRMAELGAPLE